jgi:spore coat protein A, manganese oxidase
MQTFNKRISRRDMLKLGLLGGAALMLPLERTARTESSINNRLVESQLPKPFQVPFAVPPVLRPVGRTGDGRSFYKITMQARKVQILPSGYPATTIYGYNGITPGPTIAAQRGAPIVVRQINKLPNTAQFNYPTWTSVHLHG